MKRKIIFRADSSPEIGMGHVYRLISLIKSLHLEFECMLVTNNIHAVPSQELAGINLKLIEVNMSFKYSTPGEKKTIQEVDFDLNDILHGDEIVVLDGYWFGELYQKALKSIGIKLIVIDDFANAFFNADIIINQAPGISESMYKACPHTIFLLGPDFAMLRPSFLELAGRGDLIVKKKDSILVSFGGSDFYDYTNMALEVIVSSAYFSEINVVVGGGYKKIDNLQFKYGNLINIHHSLLEKEMASLMSRNEMALVPSSGVLFEALAAGCKILTGYYTQNQRLIYDGFVAKQLVVGCGNFREFGVNFFEFYKNIATLRTPKQTIDGLSGERIKKAISNLTFAY